jgi:uncharacterized membrane protein HdeD (DUF308 family)
MQTELRLHQLVVGILVLLLLLFIFIVLPLYPRLADPRFDVIVSLAVVVAAAAVFAMIGMVEGVVALQFGPGHKRELLGYLLLGLVSLASGLFLAISEDASIQTIALVAAPHAVLFGIGELRLATYVQRHPAKRRGFLIGGICEVVLGIALAGALYLSSQRAALLLGSAAILSTVQLVPFLFYKRQSSFRSRNRNGLVRRAHGKGGTM